MKQHRTLILVVTKRCNLSCRFCPVLKRNESMEWDVAEKAASIFFKKYKKGRAVVKFFGGEPLFAFGLIEKTIRYIGKDYPHRDVYFSIPTNGTLITGKIYEFLKQEPRLEIMVNAHSLKKGTLLRRLLQLPDVGITITVTPQNVVSFSTDFLKFVEAGFRKFNFLPAYYMRWSKEKQKVLAVEFAIISSVARRLRQKKSCFSIKNLYVESSTPLFNEGCVIDCNGDLFGSNIILSQRFLNLRPRLKKGNVKIPQRIQWMFYDDVEALMKKNIPKKIYEDTRAVDRILSAFVKELRRIEQTH